jgi:transcriptional repressor NrdR
MPQGKQAKTLTARQETAVIKFLETTRHEDTCIRRRRECGQCGHRFTTFERLEEIPLIVVKNSGERQPFDPRKIVTGLLAASKGRPLTEVDFEGLAARVEERLRHEGSDATSEAIGLAVLDELGRLDPVAYLRFASVYKDFENIDDFEREARLIKVEPRP